MTRRDGRGQDTVVWDSRNYGERLAVVGKDALTAGWPNRPFQVEWSPGEVVFLEVYDRKNRALRRAQAVHPVVHQRRRPIFRSRPAIFTLEPQQQARSAARSPAQSHRAQQPARRRPEEPRPQDPSRVADRFRSPHRHQVSPDGPEEAAA